MNVLEKIFNKEDRKVIHDLASKPKLRRRAYSMWKCTNAKCSEEFYFQTLRCPICTSDIRTVKKFTQFVEYPIMKYV